MRGRHLGIELTTNVCGTAGDQQWLAASSDGRYLAYVRCTVSATTVQVIHVESATTPELHNAASAHWSIAFSLEIETGGEHTCLRRTRLQ